MNTLIHLHNTQAKTYISFGSSWEREREREREREKIVGHIAFLREKGARGGGGGGTFINDMKVICKSGNITWFYN